MVWGLNSVVVPSSITSNGKSDSCAFVALITGPETILGVAHVYWCLGLFKHVLVYHSHDTAMCEIYI